MEFKNWTAEDAPQAYMFHADVQYALNLDPENQSLSSRTVERYKRLIVEDALPEELCKRYRPSGYLLFGDTKKDADSRRRLREQVARDMHDLIARFADDEKHNARSTFTMVVRVFHEQCEVIEDKMEILDQLEEGEVECCPRGEKPLESSRDEATSAFRERYRKRSGIEAPNSILKRKTGLGRVRVRGRPSVFHSILLKVAGWNLLQAARALAMRRQDSESQYKPMCGVASVGGVSMLSTVEICGSLF